MTGKRPVVNDVLRYIAAIETEAMVDQPPARVGSFSSAIDAMKLIAESFKYCWPCQREQVSRDTLSC